MKLEEMYNMDRKGRQPNLANKCLHIKVTDRQTDRNDNGYSSECCQTEFDVTKQFLWGAAPSTL